MLEELPESAESLRYIRVMVHDPEFVPFFGRARSFAARTSRPSVLEAKVASRCARR